MFQILMGAKQSGTSVQFDKETADAPQISRSEPRKRENDLRSAVVASGDDAGPAHIVFPEDAAVIDQLDVGVARQAVVVGVADHLVPDEHQVFWLDVGVNVTVAVEKAQGLQQVPSHGLHVG